MGLYAIIMLLNMGLEDAEELPFKLDDDQYLNLGYESSGPFFIPETGGDGIADADQAEPERFLGGTLDGMSPPRQPLLLDSELKRAFLKNGRNGRRTAADLRVNHQTVFNRLKNLGYEPRDVGRPSDLTPLLPDIAAARADGISWKQLEEELGFDRRAMQQALGRHKIK